MNQIFTNKKIGFLFLGLFLACMVSLSFFVQSCSQEDDMVNTQNEIPLSKSEYETILKTEVDTLMSKVGPMGESFLMKQGLPVWEKRRWINANSQDMLIIPLVSSGDTKKCIIGVISKNTITPVIFQSLATDGSKNRIFSLDNRLLYDNGKLISIPRLKSDDECAAAQQAAENLLQNGGNVQNLYNCFYGSSSYGWNEGSAEFNAGTLTLNASASGEASSTNTDGHAWITYTDNCGNTTTFGTWGFNPATPGSGDPGYYINAEQGRTADQTYSVSITYSQFQSILNYNNTGNNASWSPTYNCAGYASGVWQAVTGQTVNGTTIPTPSGITDWIKNQKK